jgi:hypothetical protein
MDAIQLYCETVTSCLDTSMPVNEKVAIFQDMVVKKLKQLESENMGVIGYAFYALMKTTLLYPDLCQQPVVQRMLEQGMEQVPVLREVVAECGLSEEEKQETLQIMKEFEAAYTSSSESISS